MSPVFITAIQFSKCAPLVGGNFIITHIPEFVKRFFQIFSTGFSGVFSWSVFPLAADFLIISQVNRFVKHFFYFFKLFFRSPCRSLATDAILTHTPHFVNTFFDKLFYKTPPLKKAAFVHFKLSAYLRMVIPRFSP